MDFLKAASNAQRLIRANGRPVQLYKLDGTLADPLKPWRGAGAPTDTELVEEYGVFAIGNTAIPTESRGLAFDWVDSELLRVTRHVFLLPALDLPPMEDYKTVIDVKNGNTRWNIIWGQCLQPAEQRILYCFGLKQ
jgi:hypothetical protein